MSSIIILIFSMLSANLGYGKNLFQANKLDVEYSILDSKNRDPYTPQYTGLWKERAALKWNVSILDFLYWDNNIHTETVRSSGQVKTRDGTGNFMYLYP